EVVRQWDRYLAFHLPDVRLGETAFRGEIYGQLVRHLIQPNEEGFIEGDWWRLHSGPLPRRTTSHKQKTDSAELGIRARQRALARPCAPYQGCATYHGRVQTDSAGDVIKYNDFTVTPANEQGVFKSFADPNGNTISVTSWTSDGKAGEVQRSNGSL